MATAGDSGGPPAPVKVGVGRSTVLDMLSNQLRSQMRLANRTWMYAFAGVLALVAIVIGLNAWRTSAKLEEAKQNIGTTKEEILAKTGR